MCLCVLILIPACGGASPSPTVTPAPATVINTPAPTRTTTPTHPAPIGLQAAALKGIRIKAWHAFAGPAQEVFSNQVNLFNASNEWGIWVDPTGLGDYTSLFEAVNTSLGAGAAAEGPDLVASLPEETLAWAGSNAIVDLTPYLDDPDWGLNAESLADIPPVFLAQDNVGGVQWGLPAQRSARFLYYNLTWARELGFQDPPATPADFRKQACAANASFKTDASPSNDSYGGWIVDTDWQTSYSWLLGLDGSLVEAGSYGFRTDPNLAALQYLKRLYDDHCAWLPLEPASFNSFDAFARRLALFISADLSEIRQAAAAMNSLKNADQWELIPFPGQQTPVLVSYGPSYSLLKSTPEKQLAAWVFVRWLLSPENQAQWTQKTGLFSLRASSLDLLTAFRSASPQWDAAQADLIDGQNVPQLASWRKVRYILGDGLSTVFQNNTPIVKLPSILTEMDSLAQELNK